MRAAEDWASRLYLRQLGTPELAAFFVSLHMQIEVEKKFLLTPVARQAVTAGATQTDHQVMTDSYYDDANWKLATNDTFLRQRDELWELKVGDPTLPPHGERKTTRYEEITEPEEIAERLGLPSADLGAELSAAGYEAFAVITTDRTTYQKDGFTIVLDHVTYPEGDSYDIIEIELVGDSLEDAEQRILDYASKLGLPHDSVLGKLQEYCVRHRPDHISAMKEAGQIA